MKYPSPVSREWRKRARALAWAFALAIAALPLRAAPGNPLPALAELEQQTKAAIARVRPAVVNVSTFGIHAIAGGGGAVLPYRSIGAGVIIDPRGYVLTNAHVVQHAQSIKVTPWRAQPSELSGKLLQVSEELDLAIIELPQNGSFPYAVFGRSGAARIGERVIALGSPYGFAHSVTMGIVSGLGRDLQINGHPYRDLIQTDAAINQGNSGGPLINLAGEIIGISTAIYAPDGVSAGIGFAISARQAQSYLAQVLPSRGLFQLVAQIEKEPIRPDAKVPHRSMGPCGNCHTFKTVAPQPGITIGYTVTDAPSPQLNESSNGRGIKWAFVFAIAAALFVLLIIRARRIAKLRRGDAR